MGAATINVAVVDVVVLELKGWEVRVAANKDLVFLAMSEGVSPKFLLDNLFGE